MKISDVRVYTMGSAWRNFVFARVRTDEGIEGVGEARPVNREEAVAAYLEAIAHRYVIGSDPFNVEDLVLRITRDDYEIPGATEMTAIAIVEIACWGHHWQGGQPTGLPAPGRGLPRAHSGIRQRLVHRRAHPRGVCGRSAAGRRAGVPRPEA